MNNFDLGDMRELAYRMLDKGATVPQVRLALAEKFDKYTFTIHNDGSVFAVSDHADYAVPTRIF